MRNKLPWGLKLTLLIPLLALLLSACGDGGTGLVKNIDAAISKVPDVVAVKTEFNNSAGMSKRINVRITADSAASLDAVLSDSLHAFADAAGSTQGSISVAYYVFPAGDEENGLRPDAVGLQLTPSVDEIRQFAKGN